jgi:hypothetical protein
VESKYSQRSPVLLPHLIPPPSVSNFHPRGYPRVCDVNNNILSDGLTVSTGCDSGGKGFMCDDYIPTPTAENMSYGFANMVGNDKCCKCYQLTWTSGNARGKSMIVQAINTAPAKDAIKKDDIIILTPGGGTGGNSGCRYQYGTAW